MIRDIILRRASAGGHGWMLAAYRDLIEAGVAGDEAILAIDAFVTELLKAKHGKIAKDAGIKP